MVVEKKGWSVACDSRAGDSDRYYLFGPWFSD